MKYKIYHQETRYSSPWRFWTKVKILSWEVSWMLFCSWTPKPFNSWRLMWLKAFGAAIHGSPFVHQKARIIQPWHLTMYHKSCLGDGAVAYCLGPVILRERCIVAQEAYLCTGTHDFTKSTMELMTAPIEIGADAFVGLRAIVLPGVTIGDKVVIGAGAVVTRNISQGIVIAGNPARQINSIKNISRHSANSS